MTLFVFLVFGIGLLVLIGSVAAYLAFSFLVAIGISKKLGRKCLLIVFPILLALPYAYSWMAQRKLVAMCERALPPQVLESRRDVKGFFYNGDRTYDLLSNEIFNSGFHFVETLGGGLNYKYVTHTIKNGKSYTDTFSNDLRSDYEVSVSEPVVLSPIWSLYSTDLIVIDKSSGTVLGKLTDYLWGGSPRGIRAWYMSQFYGRPSLSCGPGLSKGWVNLHIGGQERLDEYHRRDAHFIKSVLRASQ